MSHLSVTPSSREPLEFTDKVTTWFPVCCTVPNTHLPDRGLGWVYCFLLMPIFLKEYLLMGRGGGSLPSYMSPKINNYLCVLVVLERIEPQSLKIIIWGLNWTSSQVTVSCIACYNLQNEGVGSYHWYDRSIDQQLMSNRTKWELCHCFGLLSQLNVGLSMLKLKKWLQYLSSLQLSFL